MTKFLSVEPCPVQMQPAEAYRVLALSPQLSLRSLPYLWITLRAKLTVFIPLVRKLWSGASKQAAQGPLMSSQEEELGSEPNPWLGAATRAASELTLSPFFFF